MTGRVNLKLYKERVQFGEMCFKACLTANPELRMMNTAFSALRNLERAELTNFANQGGTAGVYGSCPCFWGQGLFIILAKNFEL